MDWIDPRHVLRCFDRLDIEIDHHRLTIAADEHAFERLLAAGIDLLVRHIGRDVDEVAGPASATNSSRSPQRIRAFPRTT